MPARAARHPRPSPAPTFHGPGTPLACLSVPNSSGGAFTTRNLERTAVFDLDLDESPEDQPAGDCCSDALVLVRVRRHPIGVVRVPLRGGALRVADVVDAAITAHGGELGLLFARGVLDTRRPLETLDAPGLRALLSTSADHRAVPRPLVTVAVCTRDRPEDLARCLASLNRLEYQHVDLLVVDNASTVDVGGIAGRYPGVRCVREPRAGLDWARNRAILECRGDILAFTDDDVVVDPGWVSALVHAFQADAHVMAVTGLVLPLELDTPAQHLFESYGGFGRGFRRRWWRARPGRPAALELGGAGAYGTGANMAFRRRLFDLVGGFDPALDVGTPANGGGDLDMFFRALKHGHTLAYEPAAIVWHRHRRAMPALRRQVTNNGIGFYAYLSRTACFYRDERIAVLRLGLWWFRWWSLRRLALRLVRLEQVPMRLVLGELCGSLLGPIQYLRAVRGARRVAAAHALRPELPVAAAAAPPVGVLTREAVRTVDLQAGLQPIDDISDFRRVHVYVFDGPTLLGRVALDNRGAPISRCQLREAIAGRLTYEVLDRDLRIGPDRFWSIFARALRGALMPGSGRSTDSQAGGTVGACPAGTAARIGSSGTANPTAAIARVSVVIATRDRPGDLRACLESLAAQRSRHHVDVVVVDNNPCSGITAAVVRDFPSVRVEREPRQGLSYARNRGILAASGDVIVTTDDDVVCPPGWLDALIAGFSRADVMIVTGHVLPLALDTRAQQMFELYGGLGRGFRPFEVGPDWFRRCRRSVPTWELGCTANAAFRASLFSDPRVGLMEEALGAGTPTGCSEDTYIFYRTLRAGFAIAYEPRAYVWHRHRSTLDALRRQLYAYSKGHVAYQLLTLMREGDRRALVRLFLELPAGYARRLMLWATRQSDYPLSCIATEMRGNFAGPFALWRALRRVRTMGSGIMGDQPAAASPPAGRT